MIENQVSSPLPSDAQTRIESVESYKDFFYKLAEPDSIFGAFRAQVPRKNQDVARVVGSLWYHLSEAIVDVLCTALARLESPTLRHYVVQTAYEELGETQESKIHTHLLRESLRAAGVGDKDLLTWSGYTPVREAIDGLLNDLRACTSDAEVCGLLLGMEIIAFENIDNVVEYLDYSEETGRQVRATEWVKLHNVLEEGHIRRAVEIFVKHVEGLPEQRKFMHKYMQTIAFWKKFWGEIAKVAEVHTVQAQA